MDQLETEEEEEEEETETEAETKCEESKSQFANFSVLSLLARKTPERKEERHLAASRTLPPEPEPGQKPSRPHLFPFFMPPFRSVYPGSPGIRRMKQ